MNDFNVLLNVVECCVDECGCKHTFEREITVTSVTQTINLFNGYTLNIVKVTDTYFTVLVQNGTQIVLRNIYTNYPTTIILPDTNCCHSLAINGTVVST